MRKRPWAQAWSDALYGANGFYRGTEGPGAHFRTAAHASAGQLGAAVARLARLAGCSAVLDVGAGRGELLTGVSTADPALRCTGVDVVARPAGLDPRLRWRTEVPAVEEATLLVAWELLDVVPVPVLEVDAAGRPRVVEVSADGAERLAGEPDPLDLEWCERWWPPAGAGSRIEVGRAREEVWGALVDGLAGAGGLALAVDYGHDGAARPAGGSLAGYAHGRLVDPVPDGSCDLTAHVALDALAACRPGGVRLLQADALRALGIDAARPHRAIAGTDPLAYLSALQQATEAAELLDPSGLGGFGWVLHPVGTRCAEALARTFPRRPG